MIERYGLEETQFMLDDKRTKDYKQYEYEEMIIKRYQFITELQENKKKYKKVLQFN